jgi:hypothetical protein
MGEEAMTAKPSETPRTERARTLLRAINRIEEQVTQLDKWAKEAADKGDYSTAGSNQKAAVDLHCAVEIIKGKHSCRHPGFRQDLGDVCDRCGLDEELK